MRINFWGVGGSIPTPERRNSRYGGNTPCVEVRLDDGNLIILDCGTGLRALGNSLVRNVGCEPIRAHIFLTHFHWDHVQGIPFFAPFNSPLNTFVIRAATWRRQEIEAVIKRQMMCPFFPVKGSAKTRRLRHPKSFSRDSDMWRMQERSTDREGGEALSPSGTNREDSVCERTRPAGELK